MITSLVCTSSFSVTETFSGEIFLLGEIRLKMSQKVTTYILPSTTSTV